MKLQHLTAFAFVLLGVTSLACSAPDGEIFMGSDDSGSAGSSAGTQEPGGGAGTGSSGKSQGGSASGGRSSGGSSNEAGSSSGGTAAGGTAAGSPSGGTGPTPWEPCAGKACGDICTVCDPKDVNCVSAAVITHCTPAGECISGTPACTVPECEGTQVYYAPGCDSLARPIGGDPFTAGCYDSCLEAKACSDGYTCTTVWHDPSAGCVPGGSCIGACGAQTMICIKG